MDRNKISRAAYDLGFNYEKQYGSCAQCAIAAVQDVLDIRNDFVFKSAGCLGAGIGKLCDGSCGGYTGGALAIGLCWGRTRDKFGGDTENKKASDRLTVQLHGRFIQEYGSVTCREIHDRIFGRRFDLWNEKDKEAFDRAGAHVDKCTSLVANAASWTTELILGELEARGQDLTDLRGLRHRDS